jgi:hypothetical protein
VVPSLKLSSARLGEVGAASARSVCGPSGRVKRAAPTYCSPPLVSSAALVLVDAESVEHHCQHGVATHGEEEVEELLTIQMFG